MLSLRLRPGQHGLVSAPGGEANFETSSEGEAVLPLPNNPRTYSITPLFDEPRELIRITGEDVCGVISE